MIKRLAGSLREYRKEALKTPVFVTCEVVLEVAIPFLMASLIDFGIDDGNINLVLRLGLILLSLALLSLFFGAQAGRSSAIASAGFARNLRRDIFYNVQTFSFSNIDKFSTCFSGIQPVEQGGSHPADVQVAGGTRRETGADFHRSGSSRRARKIAAAR